ncbi:4-(cytidine 5'-diphospho)-2-C-methyl-D-erythritol kinase [Nakamurella aerolata]|uniref:4-(cytidine 5'-diphospho)-2-C-methyl-D-erythritol kinase n=1 Tax=Nakamurella aerolata TaxID=1656892 RepID=UPI001BB1CA30|nr:4-(cytidine 5'-diphospho)-2-C-methyl-D-erythritol kinase [Nakamurella aerolata]
MTLSGFGFGEPPTTLDRIRVRVPAKINLALSVGDQRPDGYHELRTVFHAVDLYDELVLRRANRWGVSVTALGTGRPMLGVPRGMKNLAGVAGRSLQQWLRESGLPMATEPVQIDIIKAIPLAGGMAGGSADAAAALVGCNALWGAELSRDELAEVAAGVGSDVAFALHGGTAVGTGRGELLSPVLTRMTLHWVLALSGDGLSTPEVFAELDRLRLAHRTSPDREPSGTATGGSAIDGTATGGSDAAAGVDETADAATDLPRPGAFAPESATDPAPVSGPEPAADPEPAGDPGDADATGFGSGAVEDVIAALRSGEVSEVAAALHNDLQPAAVSLDPALRRTLRAGTESGALAAIVSGSGPTVALLCSDADHAQQVAGEMAGSGTCRTVRTASGPVPGARVV